MHPSTSSTPNPYLYLSSIYHTITSISSPNAILTLVPGQLNIYTASPSKDYRKRLAPLTYVVLSVYTHIYIGCGTSDICWQLSVWQWDVCADAGLCDGVLVPGDHTCPLSGTRRLFWCTGKHALQIGPWRSVVAWKLEQSSLNVCLSSPQFWQCTYHNCSSYMWIQLFISLPRYWCNNVTVLLCRQLFKCCDFFFSVPAYILFW